MRQYQNQAFAVQVQLNNVREKDDYLETESTETIACLSDAVTTLNALALIGEKKILILDDLIKVAEEFCIDAPSMDLCELIEYQDDFKKLLEKI